MQATVLTFDADTSGGTVVLDDGTELPFSAEAFVAGGLRLLRPGQRVRLATDEDGRIVALTIHTLPDPR